MLPRCDWCEAASEISLNTTTHQQGLLGAPEPQWSWPAAKKSAQFLVRRHKWAMLGGTISFVKILLMRSSVISYVLSAEHIPSAWARTQMALWVNLKLEHWNSTAQHSKIAVKVNVDVSTCQKPSVALSVRHTNFRKNRLESQSTFWTRVISGQVFEMALSIKNDRSCLASGESNRTREHPRAILIWLRIIKGQIKHSKAVCVCLYSRLASTRPTIQIN